MALLALTSKDEIINIMAILVPSLGFRVNTALRRREQCSLSYLGRLAAEPSRWSEAVLVVYGCYFTPFWSWVAAGVTF